MSLYRLMILTAIGARSGAFRHDQRSVLPSVMGGALAIVGFGAATPDMVAIRLVLLVLLGACCVAAIAAVRSRIR